MTTSMVLKSIFKFISSISVKNSWECAIKEKKVDE
jgi:hypothetical protein